MITPKLFSISSTELGRNENPSDPENCSVCVVAVIGPSDGKGGDNFSFEVTTPNALSEANYSRWGRGLLIVDSFSWSAVENKINGLLAHAARNTWVEVARELNKELHWEFENYQSYGG
jgi:hypothetical protein